MVPFGRRQRPSNELDAINRYLSDFGFTAAKSIVVGVDGSSRHSMRLPSTGLGLVSGRGGSQARVPRKDETLGEAEIHGKASWFTKAFYLADEKLLVFTWHMDEPEGCAYEGDLAGAELMDLSGTPTGAAK